jgi:hypothetical protein
MDKGFTIPPLKKGVRGNGTDLRDVMLHSINYYLHYNKSSKLQRSVIFIEKTGKNISSSGAIYKSSSMKSMSLRWSFGLYYMIFL